MGGRWIRVRFRLIDWLNRHWGMVLFVGLLPSMLVVLFVFMYMSSLSRMVAVLRHNADISGSSVLLPVREVLGDEVVLDGTGDFPVKVRDGDLVYTLVFYGVHSFEYRCPGGESYPAYGCLLVDGVESLEDGYAVSVLGNVCTLQPGDMVLEVWVSGDGFNVVSGGVGTQVVADGVGKWMPDGSFMVSTGQREPVPADAEMYYLQSLPGGLWMDVFRGSYVSGVSDSFRWGFVAGSGLPAVSIMLLLLSVVLYLAMRWGRLKAFSGDMLFKVNFGAMLVLVLLVVFTFIML